MIAPHKYINASGSGFRAAGLTLIYLKTNEKPDIIIETHGQKVMLGRDHKGRDIF